MNEPQNPPWTPGPWEVDEDYPCNVSTADHRTIAETCDSWFNLEISRANARLIAAAPELVAALEELLATRNKPFEVLLAERLFNRNEGRWEKAEDEALVDAWIDRSSNAVANATALLARVRGEEKQG